MKCSCQKKNKNKTVSILRGTHRTPEPTETQLPPEGSACSLWSTVPLGTRGLAQREISHSRGIKGTCCHGNVPRVSPEAQEEKAWGRRERRETPSKEAVDKGRPPGGHGREAGVQTPGRPQTRARRAHCPATHTRLLPRHAKHLLPLLPPGKAGLSRWCCRAAGCPVSHLPAPHPGRQGREGGPLLL